MVKGFRLKALNKRSTKAIRKYYKELAFKKKKITEEPFVVEFYFNIAQRAHIKEKDFWFIEKMLKTSHQITLNLDYELEPIT